MRLGAVAWGRTSASILHKTRLSSYLKILMLERGSSDTPAVAASAIPVRTVADKSKTDRCILHGFRFSRAGALQRLGHCCVGFGSVPRPSRPALAESESLFPSAGPPEPRNPHTVSTSQRGPLGTSNAPGGWRDMRSYLAIIICHREGPGPHRHPGRDRHAGRDRTHPGRAGLHPRIRRNHSGEVAA